MEALIDSSCIRVFGKDFLDAQAVTGALTPSVKFKPVELSPLELELERAKARGEFLIHDEAFFMEDTPNPGLALVSKGLIPDSTNKDYHQQTQILADYITNEVFCNRRLSEVYQKAVDQWEKEKPYLKKLLRSDWHQAAEGLSGLEINQRFRESPVEALQDLLVPFRVSGERRLLNVATWTKARSSDGALVLLGDFGSDGASVDGWDPRFAYPFVGVCFSAALTDLGL